LTARSQLILIPMAKSVTREQAERKKTQAAAFMERIGEPDRASEFDPLRIVPTISSTFCAKNPSKAG
jgi:hypothetical protein